MEIGKRLIILSPRQEDIYNQMKSENIKTPSGKDPTPEWVQHEYPSTDIQPRKSKRAKSQVDRALDYMPSGSDLITYKNRAGMGLQKIYGNPYNLLDAPKNLSVKRKKGGKSK
jgi:hypothetical protein